MVPYKRTPLRGLRARPKNIRIGWEGFQDTKYSFNTLIFAIDTLVKYSILSSIVHTFLH